LGVNVDLIVTLDPVAIEGARFARKWTASQTKWVNVFVPREFRVLGNGQLINPDRVAMLGRAMGAQLGANRNVALSRWEGREFGLTGHMAVVGDGPSYTVFDRILTELEDLDE
jgi:hypothetical protein